MTKERVDRFLSKRERRYFDALASTDSVKLAASKLELDPQTLYNWLYSLKRRYAQKRGWINAVLAQRKRNKLIRRMLRKHVDLDFGDRSMTNPETVWVVYKSHGEWEGTTVYAICYSAELAEKARIRLAAGLQNPLKDFEVAEVATDAVHLYGILVQERSFDLKTREA